MNTEPDPVKQYSIKKTVLRNTLMVTLIPIFFISIFYFTYMGVFVEDGLKDNPVINFITEAKDKFSKKNFERKSKAVVSKFVKATKEGSYTSDFTTKSWLDLNINYVFNHKFLKVEHHTTDVEKITIDSNMIQQMKMDSMKYYSDIITIANRNNDKFVVYKLTDNEFIYTTGKVKHRVTMLYDMEYSNIQGEKFNKTVYITLTDNNPYDQIKITSIH